MRIVYVVETLSVVGGIEKMIIEKANYITDKFCYDVTIISCTQNKLQENAFTLSSNVKQINLAIPYYKQYRYRYPKRLWVKLQTKKLLIRELENAVTELKPDIIIGTLKFEADIICKLKCHAKKIIECHEARPFAMSDLEHNRSFLSHIYIQYYLRRKYFKTIEEKADMVVTLTEGDKDLWNGARRAEVIPNFSTMSPSIGINKQKRIIAVGRLSAEKGYDRLITIWKQVSTKHPDWKLDIFGDGKLHNYLQELIENSGCNNIILHPSTKNISEEYAKSSMYVMTSLFEGFSLTLLEAMIHGLPSIAFDCPFGPRSLINNGENGFLVKEGDTNEFAKKTCYLIENPDIMSKFSTSAVAKASTFNIDTIMGAWKSLFLSIK